MKTNTGLVEYAKKALAEKWGYVWGTYGQILTENLLRAKINQYPIQVGNYQNIIRQKWLNGKTSDCIGLIKSYMWDKDGKVTYNPTTDINANMMFNNAKEKGVISTIPEIAGLAVYKQGHIGVYIGNGQVIEAHSTNRGVIQTPLRGVGATAWTYWLKVPYIDYEGVDIVKPVLKSGSKGTFVKELQSGLLKLGYDLGSYGADGSFGNATDIAVKSFQRKHGLAVDGIVGQATWNKLNELLKSTEKPIAGDSKYKNTLISIRNTINEVLGE